MSELRSLLVAIREGDVARLRQTLRAGPELLAARTPEGSGLVLAALWAGQAAVAEELCAAGAEVDFPTAVALGEVAAVEEGLAIDPGLADVPSGDGYPPLALAAVFGRVEILDLLLAAGATVDRPATAGLAPQAIHCALGHPDPPTRLALLERLLAAGADPDAAQHGGFTPLMLAARRGDAAAVEHLLAAGADPTRESDAGTRAADLAAGRSDVALTERLRVVGVTRRA